MQKYTTQLVLVEDSRGTGGMHSTCYEGVGGWGERGLHAQRVTFESAGLGMAPGSAITAAQRISPLWDPVQWTEKCPQGCLRPLPVWWTK